MLGKPEVTPNLVLFSSVSDSGYKRTWQQVKVKHKNIVQTGKLSVRPHVH